MANENKNVKNRPDSLVVERPLRVREIAVWPRHTKDVKLVPVSPLLGAQHVKGKIVIFYVSPHLRHLLGRLKMSTEETKVITTSSEALLSYHKHLQTLSIAFIVRVLLQWRNGLSLEMTILLQSTVYNNRNVTVILVYIAIIGRELYSRRPIIVEWRSGFTVTCRNSQACPINCI